VIDQQSVERAAERFSAPQGSFERLTHRRNRKRRDQRIRAGVLGIAIAIAVGWLGVNAIRSTPIPADDPTPAPAPVSLGALAYGVDGDIYVSEWDGSNPLRIADGRPPSDCRDIGEYWAEGPIWSPDGRYLAYRHTDCEGARDAWWDVVISDAEGNVVASFHSEGWQISWSPDSTRVAVWVHWGETIGVYGLDGERQALLTVPPGMGSPGDHDPMWQPDGESLLIPNAVEIPLDGSSPRRLPWDRASAFTTYSPDGSRVAYTARRALVVAAADGSDPQEVFGEWAAWPVWSPAGDRLAFVPNAFRDWVPHQLRVLDMGTGTVTLLAEWDGSEWISLIGFSPDGERILFSRTGDAGAAPSSLWSINADGSDLRRLVAGTAQGDWFSPSPTP
jgi:Tol biopolymer transport system component